MKIEKFGAGVFTVDNVLTSKECQDYIHLSESEGYDLATIQAINGPEINTEIRNNDRLIYDSNEVAEFLCRRSKKFLPESIDGC